MVYAEEDGDEYFYATVQKGTPRENWLFVKMKTDGTVVQKITAPPEAGFKAPNEWRLTAAVPAPDGTIFIANGYGDSRLFRFDKNGEYAASYAGKGRRMAYSTAVMGWRLIRAMTSRYYWSATVRTAGCAISTSTESSCGRSHCICGGHAR